MTLPTIGLPLAGCVLLFSACASAPVDVPAEPAPVPVEPAPPPSSPAPPPESYNQSSVSSEMTGDLDQPLSRILILLNADDGAAAPVPEIADQLAGAINRSRDGQAGVFMIDESDPDGESAYRRAIEDIRPEGVLAMKMDEAAGTIRAFLLLPQQRDPVWELTLRSSDPSGVDPFMTGSAIFGAMSANGVLAR